MSPRRCLVRGSINNDEYFYVDAIVQSGQTISSTRYQRRPGGKGANQAAAIAKAGAPVDLVASVGLSDGTWLLEYLHSLAVATHSISLVQSPTGRAIIQLAQNGDNSIILFPGANFHPLPDPPRIDPEIYSHLLVQNEVLFSSTVAYLRLATANRITTLFNPSPMPSPQQLASFPWNCLDWLILNKGEALSLCQAFHLQHDTPIDVSLSALHRSPPFSPSTNIICTLGAEGLVALLPISRLSAAPDPPIIRLPAASLSAPVIDTTGAGDCFTGYFVAGLMSLPSTHTPSLSDLESILKQSIKAAGISVQRQGTIDSIPTLYEL